MFSEAHLHILHKGASCWRSSVDKVFNGLDIPHGSIFLSSRYIGKLAFNCLFETSPRTAVCSLGLFTMSRDCNGQ